MPDVLTFKALTVCHKSLYILSSVFVIFGIGFTRPNIICLGASLAQKLKLCFTDYFILIYGIVGLGQTTAYSLEIIQYNFLPLAAAMVSLMRITLNNPHIGGDDYIIFFYVLNKDGSQYNIFGNLPNTILQQNNSQFI